MFGIGRIGSIAFVTGKISSVTLLTKYQRTVLYGRKFVTSGRNGEMEATSKLEAMLSRVSGVKEITSRSGNGWGRIRLGLDKYTPIDIARFEASTIIRQTWPQLPENVSYPSLSVRKPDEKSERPFLNYTLNAATLPISIQHYAEDVIKPKLSEIQGIYKINISGATPMEWQLTYDAKQLQKLGISSRTISSAIHYYQLCNSSALSTRIFGNGKIDFRKGQRRMDTCCAGSHKQ